MKQSEDYSLQAAAWVNLLVPGRFSEAKAQVAEHCTYDYQNQALRGPDLVQAFVESDRKAEEQLDSIEYLRSVPAEFSSAGALIAVADRLTLNGKNHTYRDRLLVKMSLGKVVRVEHQPIAEERRRLKEFLESAGPKLTKP